ncbi:MAG TPA: alpha/beta hydrolase, partial [Microlunatus sp.]|nr:alpha/beta hydrolase [Microlunatus sp.]
GVNGRLPNRPDPGGRLAYRGGGRMSKAKVRVLSPARIAALALILVAILGLAYLSLGADHGSVSVPAGAKAGDLTLRPCNYQTEAGEYAADCGVLVVPENRARSGSRLIALPLIRVRTQSPHPGEPVFYLEGGPGLSNMRFAQASRYAVDRDVVLVGYRGVDGSVRLDCPEVEAALEHSTDMLSQASFRGYADGFRSCARRLTQGGVDLAGYGLPQQIDDFEAARIALGYERINLLSQSAGTRTAMIYTWLHPAAISRSVMIGVNPPGNFLWDPKVTDEQIRRYADLCSHDRDCSRRTTDLAATMRSTAADLPNRWLLLRFGTGSARVAAFYGLMESTSTAGLMSAPATIDAWLAAADGDRSGVWLQSVVGDIVLPRSFVWGEYAAAGMLDAQAARDYFPTQAHQQDSLGYAGSAVTWGGGQLADAWPPAAGESAYRRVRTSSVETLLIGGQLDLATPPQIATAQLLPYLPQGHQVVLSNVGHIASFFAEQPAAGTHLVNTFLSDGRVDTSLYQPQQVDLTPATTTTATAKELVGVIVGLTGLTIAALILMVHRVRTRGQLGAKTSTVMRSVGALMLGLGGWLAGLLIVWTAVPGVPIDDRFLVTAAISVPVGLGISLAWASRAQTHRARAVGFAAAAAGSIAGVWLGFGAASGFLALATAIVGAVVGANLCLIAFDIITDRRRQSKAHPMQPIAITHPDPVGHGSVGR